MGGHRGYDRVNGVQFGMGGGIPLLLDIYRPRPLPDALMPAVIWLHGGAWAFGDRSIVPRLVGRLAQAGFLVASVDYRLSGQAPFPAHIHDVKAAIRWLRAHAGEYGVDPDRIGISGHSAGGHLAALAGTSGDVPQLEGESGSPGTSSRVQAVVPLAPATDFEAFDRLIRLHGLSSPELEALFGGPIATHPDLVRTANPIAYINDTTPPFLIVHGDADGTVPVSQSDLLAEALRSHGRDVAYFRVAGGLHHLHEAIDPFDVEESGSLLSADLEDRIIAFLTRCLGPTE